MPNACGHRIGSDKLFIKRYLFALDIVLVDILRNKWVGRAIPIPRDPRPHRPSRVCAGTDRTSQNHRSGHMLRPHAPATCSGASHGQAQAFAGSGLRNGRRNRRPAVDCAERHKRMSCKAIREREMPNASPLALSQRLCSETLESRDRAAARAARARVAIGWRGAIVSADG